MPMSFAIQNQIQAVYVILDVNSESDTGSVCDFEYIPTSSLVGSTDQADSSGF